MSRNVDLSAYVPPDDGKHSSGTGSLTRGQLLIDINFDDDDFVGKAPPPPPPKQVAPPPPTPARQQPAPTQSTTVKSVQMGQPLPHGVSSVSVQGTSAKQGTNGKGPSAHSAKQPQETKPAITYQKPKAFHSVQAKK